MKNLLPIKNINIRLGSRVLQIFLLCISFHFAQGQTTWVGQISSDWATGGNWDTGLVPGAADDAIIPANSTVVISSSAVALSIVNDGMLTIMAAGDLTIDGSTSHGITNNDVLNNDGTIEIGLNSNVFGNGIENNADLTNNGTISTGSSGSATGAAIRSVGNVINNGTVNIGSGANYHGFQINDGAYENYGIHNSAVNSYEFRISNNSVVDNYGIINCNGNNVSLSIYSSANITNHSCGEFYGNWLEILQQAVWNNDGYVFLEKPRFSLANAPFNNNGTVNLLDEDYGFNMPIVNNDIIIRYTTTSSSCNLISPAFEIGSNLTSNLSIYTDAAATSSAGTYDATTNTFYANYNLVSGLQTLYVRVEDMTGNCSDVIAEWILDLTVSPCCDLLTWTGATDNDWHTASNWSPTYVPTTCNEVLIPTGTSNDPLISASAVAYNITVDGVLNLAAGSDLAFDEPSSQIRVNASGEVNNNGSINFGQNAYVANRAIVNFGDFNNEVFGILYFDQVGINGQSLIRNSGAFVNDGLIEMNNLMVGGPFGFINITNTSTFINNGIFESDRGSDGALRNLGTIHNYGLINIELGWIANHTDFYNHECAVFSAFYFSGLAGTIFNEGLIKTVAGGRSDFTGSVINDGVIYSENGYGLGPIPINNSIIIVDENLVNNCGEFSPVFDLGSSPSATLSIYSDAAATNSIGTYHANLNKLTPSVMIADGSHSFFVKVSSPGCADEILPWDVTVTSATPQNANSTNGWIETVDMLGLLNNSGNDGGYADFSPMGPEIIIGGDNEIILDPGYAGASQRVYWRIYIDYDQDGIFDHGAERAYQGNAIGLLQDDFFVSTAKASAGTANVIVTMGINGYVFPCDDTYNGEKEEYVAMLGSCVQFADGGAIIGGQAICPGNNNPSILSDISSEAGASFIWMENTTGCEFPDGSGTLGWSVIPGATSSSYDPGPLTMSTMFVRGQRASMCSNFVYSNMVEVVNTIDCTPDCASEGLSTADAYIFRFIFGGATVGINNISGDDGGYGNYTNLSGTVMKEQMTTYQLRPKFYTGAQVVHWRVWADWNQDGFYSDLCEVVVEASAANTRNGTFVVPADALTGVTNVRVAMKIGGYPDACETFGAGEVEDYTITVNPSNFAGNTDPIDLFVDNSGADQDNNAFANVDFDVSPNPTNGELNMQFKNLNEENQVSILNSLGQTIATIENVETHLSLNMKNYTSSPGVYFINVSSNNNIKTKKIFLVE